MAYFCPKEVFGGLIFKRFFCHWGGGLLIIGGSIALQKGCKGCKGCNTAKTTIILYDQTSKLSHFIQSVFVCFCMAPCCGKINKPTVAVHTAFRFSLRR